MIARKKLWEKSLELVPQYGWNTKTINLACEQLGYPSSMNAMVTPIGLLLQFNRYILSSLEIAGPWTADNFHDNIFSICRERIHLVEPFAPHLHEAISILGKPNNINKTAQMIEETSHGICCLVDNSYNMKWYARRTVIAGINTSTDLFMAQDKSPNKEDTLEFLRRRVEEARQAEKNLTKFEQAGKIALYSIGNMISK